MRIQYKERPSKLVYIWISKDEGRDSALLASLKEKYAIWRAEGYMPVVMESGDNSLEHIMHGLMKHHYESQAQRE